MLHTKDRYSTAELTAAITEFFRDNDRRRLISMLRDDFVLKVPASLPYGTEGPEGLRRLAAVADSLVTRHGGCAGCKLQKTCGTCMPLASLYRQAKAPLETYCQHRERR